MIMSQININKIKPIKIICTPKDIVRWNMICFSCLRRDEEARMDNKVGYYLGYTAEQNDTCGLPSTMYNPYFLFNVRGYYEPWFLCLRDERMLGIKNDFVGTTNSSRKIDILSKKYLISNKEFITSFSLCDDEVLEWFKHSEFYPKGLVL